MLWCHLLCLAFVFCLFQYHYLGLCPYFLSSCSCCSLSLSRFRIPLAHLCNELCPNLKTKQLKFSMRHGIPDLLTELKKICCCLSSRSTQWSSPSSSVVPGRWRWMLWQRMAGWAKTHVVFFFFLTKCNIWCCKKALWLHFLFLSYCYSSLAWNLPSLQIFFSEMAGGDRYLTLQMNKVEVITFVFCGKTL